MQAKKNALSKSNIESKCFKNERLTSLLQILIKIDRQGSSKATKSPSVKDSDILPMRFLPDLKKIMNAIHQISETLFDSRYVVIYTGSTAIRILALAV